MLTPSNVANRLLKIELQLKAYQKLHQDELAELWKVLEECKQTIAALCNDSGDDLIPLQTKTDPIESLEENE